MADLWGKVMAAVGREVGVYVIPCCACVVLVAVAVLVAVVGDVRLWGSVVSVVPVAVLPLVACVGACVRWVFVGLDVGMAPVVGWLAC